MYVSKGRNLSKSVQAIFRMVPKDARTSVPNEQFSMDSTVCVFSGTMGPGPKVKMCVGSEAGSMFLTEIGQGSDA